MISGAEIAYYLEFDMTELQTQIYKHFRINVSVYFSF